METGTDVSLDVIYDAFLARIADFEDIQARADAELGPLNKVVKDCEALILQQANLDGLGLLEKKRMEAALKILNKKYKQIISSQPPSVPVESVSNASITDLKTITPNTSSDGDIKLLLYEILEAVRNISVPDTVSPAAGKATSSSSTSLITASRCDGRDIFKLLGAIAVAVNPRPGQAQRSVFNMIDREWEYEIFYTAAALVNKADAAGDNRIALIDEALRIEWHASVVGPRGVVIKYMLSENSSYPIICSKLNKCFGHMGCITIDTSKSTVGAVPSSKKTLTVGENIRIEGGSVDISVLSQRPGKVMEALEDETLRFRNIVVARDVELIKLEALPKPCKPLMILEIKTPDTFRDKEFQQAHNQTLAYVAKEWLHWRRPAFAALTNCTNTGELMVMLDWGMFPFPVAKAVQAAQQAIARVQALQGPAEATAASSTTTSATSEDVDVLDDMYMQLLQQLETFVATELVPPPRIQAAVSSVMTMRASREAACASLLRGEGSSDVSPLQQGVESLSLGSFTAATTHESMASDVSASSIASPLSLVLQPSLKVWSVQSPTVGLLVRVLGMMYIERATACLDELSPDCPITQQSDATDGASRGGSIAAGSKQSTRTKASKSESNPTPTAGASASQTSSTGPRKKGSDITSANVDLSEISDITFSDEADEEVREGSFGGGSEEEEVEEDVSYNDDNEEEEEEEVEEDVSNDYDNEEEEEEECDREDCDEDNDNDDENDDMEEDEDDEDDGEEEEGGEGEGEDGICEHVFRTGDGDHSGHIAALNGQEVRGESHDAAGHNVREADFRGGRDDKGSTCEAVQIQVRFDGAAIESIPVRQRGQLPRSETVYFTDSLAVNGFGNVDMRPEICA